MHDLRNLEISVLLQMLAAQSSDYGRVLTDGEAIDCDKTIKQIQDEIASRKNKEEPGIPVTRKI